MEGLQEIGLTKNESKVYSVLAQFGKLSAGEISAKSSVPYSRIYDVLGSLVHKGLVEIVPEKTKKFIATSPDSLLKIIDEREALLEKAREDAKKLKQFYFAEEKNPVIIGEGEKAFYKIVEQMKDAKKYVYDIKWTSEYNPKWAEEKRRRLKKGIDDRSLVRYDKETEENIRQWAKINKNIRKFENDGVALSIVDDEEVMIALIKSNVTLLIKSKPFAKIMKKMFLDSYSNASVID